MLQTVFKPRPDGKPGVLVAVEEVPDSVDPVAELKARIEALEKLPSIAAALAEEAAK